MITYSKLWILLEKKGMKRTDLKQIISSATLAKLGKNEPVSISVIEKICNFLKCQPGDIMENITKEDMEKAAEIMNSKINEMMKMLQTVTGMEKEALINEFIKNTPIYAEKLRQDKIDLFSDIQENKKSE